MAQKKAVSKKPVASKKVAASKLITNEQYFERVKLAINAADKVHQPFSTEDGELYICAFLVKPVKSGKHKGQTQLKAAITSRARLETVLLLTELQLKEMVNRAKPMVLKK